MRKVFFFLAAMTFFFSCTSKFDITPPELSFDSFFELKADMQARLDTCKVGVVDGTYPAASFDKLQDALDDLKEGITKARAGVFILQFEVDSYIFNAQKALANFDSSVIKNVEPGRPAELFVNGIDAQGWIDFGESQDYCGGPEFTVELWTKYPENFIEFGFGSLLATFQPLPYEGWTLHYWGTTNSAIRFSIGTDNPNEMLTLPTVYTGAPQKWNEWVHYAAVFSAEKDFLGLYINGELKMSAEVKDNIVVNKEDYRMWAFLEPRDHSRCCAGYIKNMRLWRKSMSQDEIQKSMNSEVEGTEDNLICAWDFTIKPEDDKNIVDKTGKHSAKIEGIYKWTELTE